MDALPLSHSVIMSDAEKCQGDPNLYLWKIFRNLNNFYSFLTLKMTANGLKGITGYNQQNPVTPNRGPRRY